MPVADSKIETKSNPTVNKDGERIQEMFGQIAGKYDFLNHLLSFNVDHYWRYRTTKLAPSDSEREEPMLDLCTGTGDLAISYWKRSGKQIEVVAGDFCKPMLEVGQKKIASRKADDKINFIQADAMNLPFADDSFQLVTVAFGLRNISSTDKGLEEMARVCAPGGKVAVLEFSLPWFPPFRWLYKLFFIHILPTVGQWIAPNKYDAYSYLPKSVLEFPQDEQLADRMRAAGLSNIRYTPLTLGIATLYVGEK